MRPKLGFIDYELYSILGNSTIENICIDIKIGSQTLEHFLFNMT